MECSHAHQNVTGTSGHRMCMQEVQTHALYRNCRSQAILNEAVQQVCHIAHDNAAHWQHIICSSGCMGHDVAYTKMGMNKISQSHLGLTRQPKKSISTT